MANEIKSQMHLEFVPSGLSENLPVDFKKYSKLIDMAGNESSRIRQLVGVGGSELLNIGDDISTEGIILVHNLSSFSVAIGTDTMTKSVTAVETNGGKARYTIVGHGIPSGAGAFIYHSGFADPNYNGAKLAVYATADKYDVVADTYTADGTGDAFSTLWGDIFCYGDSFIVVRNNAATLRVLANAFGEAEIEVICLED